MRSSASARQAEDQIQSVKSLSSPNFVPSHRPPDPQSKNNGRFRDNGKTLSEGT
jgi:hypothetical protein